jgi:hypothetical protein
MLLSDGIIAGVTLGIAAGEGRGGRRRDVAFDEA